MIVVGQGMQHRMNLQQDHPICGMSRGKTKTAASSKMLGHQRPVHLY